MADGRQFISVVVPTRNRRDTLGRCLEGFRLQALPADCFEVVVVDDGSDDGTGALLAEAAKGMRNLRHFRQEPGGPAAARNIGIREARGPLVLFTGDDCIPSPDLLVEHARTHRLHPSVAVLGYVTWHPDLEVTPFMRYLAVDMQFSFPRIEKTPRSVTFNLFYTSNISVEKRLLEAAGLFDEDFKDAVFEDVEMGYRLWKTGVGTVYNRRAITYHYHPVTLEEYIRRSVKRGRAAALLYRKHPELKSTDFIHLEDLTDPKVRFDFYNAVLRYHNAVGLQEVLAEPDAAGPIALIPLEDRLRNWAGESLDRLAGIARGQKTQIEALERAVRDAQQALRATQEALAERDRLVATLDEKNARKNARIDELERFELRVKSSLPFRAYLGLAKLLGRGKPPAGPR